MHPEVRRKLDNLNAAETALAIAEADGQLRRHSAWQSLVEKLKSRRRGLEEAGMVLGPDLFGLGQLQGAHREVGAMLQGLDVTQERLDVMRKTVEDLRSEVRGMQDAGLTVTEPQEPRP